MFGAEKFASTKRTFLSRCFASEVAVSNARVVFPAPDGPVTKTNSPDNISKFIFCNISGLPW